jgi:hypothetical protein
MVRVHIVSTYPPVFGPPEETIELTLRLPADFARNADEAHEWIVEALRRDDEFEIPSVDVAIPYEFSPDVVRRVVVWDDRELRS